MVKTLILPVLCLCLTSVLGAGTGSAPCEQVFREEADTFLARMPAGLQPKQADAIRLAISGDLEPLAAVRNSRNTPSALPAGVSRREISEHLTLFRPDSLGSAPTPLLIYFHGGGWTFGSINSCSRFCAAMAANGLAVLAVDYRLAPEHKFPAGLDDCISAVKTATDSLRTWHCSGISLGGDSSGGNLAIATAMSFPEVTFRSLVTFYPVTKAYPDNSPSWEDYGTGYALDSDLMEAFNHAYTADTHNPLVSPAEADDRILKTLPPLLLIGAERDILRCQGLEFANRLSQLGLEVQYEVIPGSVHLFITVPGQPASFTHAVSTATTFITAHP